MASHNSRDWSRCACAWLSGPPDITMHQHLRTCCPMQHSGAERVVEQMRFRCGGGGCLVLTNALGRWILCFDRERAIQASWHCGSYHSSDKDGLLSHREKQSAPHLHPRFSLLVSSVLGPGLWEHTCLPSTQMPHRCPCRVCLRGLRSLCVPLVRPQESDV